MKTPLLEVEIKRGYAHGFWQPVITGMLSLPKEISVPVGKLNAVCRRCCSISTPNPRRPLYQRISQTFACGY